MVCLELTELEQYVGGELNEQASRVIDTHLSTCASCRSRAEEVSANLQLERTMRAALSKPGVSDRSASPARIGPYDVLRELGRGGMGVVYEARQRHPPRLVALKLLNLARARDEHSRALFAREAAALARLSHPGIAAIHDAGATDDGRPYFAMELVHGRPLHDFARERNLSITARIQLFQQVCEAVAAAHHRGVIHRDLKPSNILVDDDGRPRVLDFGLARILEPDDFIDVQESISRPGHVVGTIPYLSPEQARGGGAAIDLRTDVYSLGVILFQLLTDELPFAIEGKPFAEAVRIMTEHLPRRPSAITPRLRGDVETIILKAMARDPAQRYQSVPALHDDLERLLTGQPILARAPTLGYQLRKLITRHKAPFAAAAVVTLMLVGLTATLAVMAARLEQRRVQAVTAQQQEALARDEADRQATIARQINEFLNEMLAAANPEQGAPRDMKVVDVLAGAAATLAQTFQDQPEVAAALHFTLGNTYRALDVLPEAERHLLASLGLRRTLHPDGHLDLAQSLNKVARLRQEQGDYAQAEALFNECLDMRRRLQGDEHADVATILNNLAWLTYLVGDLDRSESLNRQALAMRLRLLGEQDSGVATSLNNLSVVLTARGQLDEAEQCLRRSLEIDRKLRGEQHSNVASTMGNLAFLMHRQGNSSEAEELFRRVLELKRAALGPRHSDVAVCIHNLAWCMAQQGRIEEAEPHYRQAVDLARDVLGNDNPTLARSLDHLGHVRLKRGDPAEAELLLREALTIRRAKLPAGHKDVLTSMIGLALTLQERRQHEEAETLMLESHKIIQGGKGSTTSDLSRSVERLIALYERWARPDAVARWQAELESLSETAAE